MSFSIRRHHCHHCGKWSYSSRKDAKRTRRRIHRGDKGLDAYRCPDGTGGWHIGHSHRRSRKWPLSPSLADVSATSLTA